MNATPHLVNVVVLGLATCALLRLRPRLARFSIPFPGLMPALGIRGGGVLAHILACFGLNVNGSLDPGPHCGLRQLQQALVLRRVILEHLIRLLVFFLRPPMEQLRLRIQIDPFEHVL